MTVSTASAFDHRNKLLLAWTISLRSHYCGVTNARFLSDTWHRFHEVAFHLLDLYYISAHIVEIQHYQARLILNLHSVWVLTSVCTWV